MFYWTTKSARSYILLSKSREQLSRYQYATFPVLTEPVLQIPSRSINSERCSTSKMNNSKPPNILVYSADCPAKRKLIALLKDVLAVDTYTVYPVTEAQITAKAWPESTALLLLQGPVAKDLEKVFVDFFLDGGKLLASCTNLLSALLPKEFDYNAPLKEDSVPLAYRTLESLNVVQRLDRNLDMFENHRTQIVVDSKGHSNLLNFDIIAREDKENHVSMLSAKSYKTNGKALFSEIYLTDHERLSVNEAHTQLFKELLHNEMDITVKSHKCQEVLTFTNGFLIGSSEDKDLFLKHEKIVKQNLSLKNFALQFCSNEDVPPDPSQSLIPILLDQSPPNFSTAKYLAHLKTSSLGRPTLYLPVVTSSMDIVTPVTLSHGFVVIPRRQTSGNGRNNNAWLSPEGCAMFSIQLHVPLNSPLGQRLPMIQHLVAVAIVSAIHKATGSVLDVRLKWPNDIYANGQVKIGGSIINSQVQADRAIVNVGCGLNLSNSRPTVCVNDLIERKNRETDGDPLPKLQHEQLLAMIFNEIELLFDRVQSQDVEQLYRRYYDCWLHENQKVTVKGEDGQQEVAGQITGIDEYGYLLVTTEGRDIPFCVHPDGNSFDMMKGLIIPKYF
ncbi:biotin--protein ligase [Uranotaenia lowii]|uniref:biotin--protein ligase n=1 Tax=Uranotaenia lowii TaxID=190385 RepID=UPI00247902E5|nr:biotin--protein ligase [Uranotaenia lowii]